MNKRIIINSKGEAVEISKEQSFIRTVKQEIRLKELQDFAYCITSYFNENGVDINNKEFCFMIQPNFVTDRLVYLTKTEVPSSSQLVKTANEIEKHPEILCDPYKVFMYQSVVPDLSVNKPCWYYLSAGYIDFERNYCDGKRISAIPYAPIPYVQFLNELPSMINDSNKQYTYQMYNGNVDFKNTQSVLLQAFDRDISEQISQFDNVLQLAIRLYEKAKGIDLRDKNSNNANQCLYIINEFKENVYPTYVAVKNVIRKNIKGAFAIQYNGNMVKAKLNNDDILNLYIGNSNDMSCFLLNGHLIEGLDNLKYAILHLSDYKKQDWYISKVEPNIQPRLSAPKKSYIPKKEKEKKLCQ